MKKTDFRLYSSRHLLPPSPSSSRPTYLKMAVSSPATAHCYVHHTLSLTCNKNVNRLHEHDGQHKVKVKASSSKVMESKIHARAHLVLLGSGHSTFVDCGFSSFQGHTRHDTVLQTNGRTDTPFPIGHPHRSFSLIACHISWQGDMIELHASNKFVCST